jgi:glutathione peroxidase-family protein
VLIRQTLDAPASSAEKLFDFSCAEFATFCGTAALWRSPDVTACAEAEVSIFESIVFRPPSESYISEAMGNFAKFLIDHQIGVVQLFTSYACAERHTTAKREADVVHCCTPHS